MFAMSAPHATAAVNRRELFLRAADCQPVPRVPVWMMRQAGRYLPEYRAIRQKHSFLEVCKTPELTAEVSLQPFRIVGVDAVIVFCDILIPAEAMGMPLDIGDGGPVLAEPIRDAAAIARLRDFDPEQETRYLCDALRLIRRELGPDVPLLGFAAAPWTLACYMIEGRSKDGFPTAKQMLFAEPAALRNLLDVIARNTARYLQAQLDAGATAVQLFDTWGGELARAEYETVALPAVQQVIREVKKKNAPIIFYSRGTSHLLPLLARTGADVLSVDWRVDLADARRTFGSGIALQGNVDPCVLLGSPDAIRTAVRQAIEKTGGAGHILNLGHGILPNTPVENAQLFVKTAQEFKIGE